jgi:IMP dehydrogenase
MLGNVLAGTDEAPGDNIMLNGIHYKQYAGSSTHKSRHVEGVVGLVPSKGPVRDVLDSFTQGIKSGCSYQGSKNLNELKISPQFVRITNAGLAESHPHSVQIIK